LGRIIVLVKDILDFEEIKNWSSDLKANYKGEKTKINDLDKNALQAALNIKEEHDVEVVTLSVGGIQTRTAMLEVLAMGADAAYIVNDDSLREADQYATSKVLQAAINKIGDYDLILCGELALDTLSSQMGPRLAAMLDIPLISYAKELKMGDGAVEALKEYEDIDECVEAPLPCLVSVVREINEPSIPSLMRILRAKKKPTTMWSLEDLGLGDVVERKVNVMKLDTPTVERKKITIEGESTEEIVSKLIQHLKNEGAIGA
jgi:electron transfer flavoprotein beta subunit